MKYYDVDGDGNVSYEEFVRGLREPLTERRRKIVEKAFKLLDKDGSGVITVYDIIKVYDVSKNKEFIQGKKSRQEILEEFINNFEGAKGNRNG
jgi:calcyphosin